MDVVTDCFPMQWVAIAPVLPNGWIFTGEVGKLIPISRQRVLSISAAANSRLTVSVKGAVGERLEFGAAPWLGATPTYVAATIGEDGTATIQF